MKSFSLYIVIGIISFNGYAQTKKIDLQESIQAALAYSNTLKNAELRVVSGKNGVSAAKADYLPSLSLTGIGLYGFKDFVSAIPPVLPNDINSFYLFGANSMIALYAGGKIKTGNELARVQLEVNRIRLQQSTDSVVLLTQQKYWNLVNIQEQQKTISANEATLDAVIKMQKDMLAAGLVARNDLLKARVQKSQLLVNKNKLHSARRIAQLDFSMYTGIPFDSVMTMKDTFSKNTVFSLPGNQPDTLLANNPSYKLLNQRMDALKWRTQLEQGSNLPTVSLGLSAAQIGSFNKGIGNTFMPVGLLAVSVPISNGLWGRGKHLVAQRKIEESIGVNDFNDGVKQLKLGITKVWYDLSDQLSQIRYAKESLELANENFKVNQDNYKAGLSSISELLDAQAAFQTAESTLVTAFAAYRVKLANYMFVTSSLQTTEK